MALGLTSTVNTTAQNGGCPRGGLPPWSVRSTEASFDSPLPLREASSAALRGRGDTVVSCLNGHAGQEAKG